MIYLESNYTELERELSRLEDLPDWKTRMALDAVLEMAFKVTQAAVHVETGSLKGSGKSESKVSKFDHSWTGEIRYGGASPGVNNPVNYAIYEKRRGVGGAGGPSDMKGNHDFFDPLKLFGPMWVAAIKKGLGG